MPNQPPVFSSVPPAGAREGLLYSYQAKSADPDGDVINYMLEAQPDGMVLKADGLVEWTPAPGQGGSSHQVTLIASDGTSDVRRQNWEILVSANGAPVFTSGEPQPGAQVKAAYIYQATVDDPNGDAVFFTLPAAVPSGLTVDLTTGLVQWTPTIMQISALQGDHDITLKADDGQGGTALLHWTITVRAATAGEIISSPGEDAHCDRAIAVDSQDIPHVVYRDRGASALMYATMSAAGTWSYSPIDTGVDEDGYTSIALDGNDGVHIAYNTGGTLKYATRDAGGNWTTVIADGTSDGHATLAIGNAGFAHIAHQCKTSINALLYTTNAPSGAWSTVTVDEDMGDTLSMVLDSAQQPHIFYPDLLGAELRYAAPDDATPGVWKYTVLDSGDSLYRMMTPLGMGSRAMYARHGVYFQGISAAIDSWDVIHVVYRRFARHNYGLFYLSIENVPTAPSPAISVKEAVDWPWDAGIRDINADPCIAIDKNDNIRVTYSVNDFSLLGGQYVLYMAWKDPVTAWWTPGAIDFSGMNPSLAFDSTRKTHIVYRDSMDSTLRYAQRD